MFGEPLKVEQTSGFFMKLAYEDNVWMYRLWKEVNYSSIRPAA